MLFLIIASFFRSRLSLVDENVLRLCVLPNDVDVTRLSSDRYLPLMDLGRVNILLRARLFWTLVRNRWIPVARVVTMRYRYPLKMFPALRAAHTRAVLGRGMGVDRASLRDERPHHGHRHRQGGLHRAAGRRAAREAHGRGRRVACTRPRSSLPSCRASRERLRRLQA